MPGPSAGMPTLGRAWRRFWRARAWDDRHRRLQALTPLASWTRDDIRALVAHGDEIQIDRGDVVLTEDTIGYWFVVVVDGSLRVARGNRRLGSIGPGGHAGDVAILGFGPQPVTLTAAVASRLLITGRRELMTLAGSRPAVRHLLFPDVPTEEFRPYVRQLRLEGATAWRALPEPARQRAGRPPSGMRPARPGRTVSAPGPFVRLAAAAFGLPTPHPARPVTRMSRRAGLAIGTAAVAAVAVASITYHPPVMVVASAEPINVAPDVLTAAPAAAIHGRYILTAVDVRRPTAAAALMARVRGDRLLALRGTDDQQSQVVAEGHLAFSHSRSLATDAAVDALRHLGLAATTDAVTLAPRDVQGPSAGLVYALAVADALSPEDLARGRTIAAAGTLDVDGTIGPVGFINHKVGVARRSGATVLVVARGQGLPTLPASVRVVRVQTVAEAIDALRAR